MITLVIALLRTTAIQKKFLYYPLNRYMKCGFKHIGSLFVYPSLWFVVFCPNFLKLPQFPKYTKTGTTWCLDGLYVWVRPHLVWNIELNTFNDFLWLYFDLVSQNHPNPQNNLKQVQLDCQKAFTLELSIIWFEMWSWTLLISFCESFPLIWVVGPNFRNLP